MELKEVDHTVDDEIKNRKDIAEARGSDAEIITISIVGEMMGVDSETAWHSSVKKNYSYLFPHLCCRIRHGNFPRSEMQLRSDDHR